ncbi:hypothetical protein GTP81_10685 [Rugamonas sp. FT107W]|uniref:Uncharacterized protein n=1 Tax=Duganella vulcania TaxID=2692166 RepID=A0A845HEY4_9BURK|nr:hypothetical protein [Duganella vulcania]MYN17218.1 hypothetical protein [Duganella vulcania]
MAQLTVELDDREMARLRAAARARHIDPNRLTGVQLLQVLTTGHPKKAKAKGLWLSGGAVRMTRTKAVKGMAADTAVPSAAARAKRLAAVMSVHGMWKNDPDKPRDAVAYQREARAEWK